METISLQMLAQECRGLQALDMEIAIIEAERKIAIAKVKAMQADARKALLSGSLTLNTFDWLTLLDKNSEVAGTTEDERLVHVNSLLGVFNLRAEKSVPTKDQWSIRVEFEEGRSKAQTAVIKKGLMLIQPHLESELVGGWECQVVYSSEYGGDGQKIVMLKEGPHEHTWLQPISHPLSWLSDKKQETLPETLEKAKALALGPAW